MRQTQSRTQFTLAGWCQLFVILTTGLLASGCQGQAQYRFAPCGPFDRHERYAVSELILPAKPSDFATDIDGDGEPENSFAFFTQAVNGLDFFRLSATVQASIDAGKGVLLLDLESNSQEDCVGVGINTGTALGAPPKAGEMAMFETELGGEWRTLPASIVDGEFVTSQSSRQVLSQPDFVDLFLGLGNDVYLPFRIYQPQVRVRRFSDGTIEGQLNGALRADEQDSSLTVPAAQTISKFINDNPDNFEKYGKPVGLLEVGELSDEKCKIEHKNCCRNLIDIGLSNDPRDNNHRSTCKILPAEFRNSGFLNGNLRPDVQMFDADQWKPLPGGAIKNGISFGLRFRANRAEHQSACPRGTFCRDTRMLQPTQPRSLKRIWGSSHADVWAAGDGGAIYHFDGMAWQPVSSPTGNDIESISGSRADDVYIAGPSVGSVYRWDGIVWHPMQVPMRSNGLYDININNGGGIDVVYDGGISYGELLHFDGTTWTTQTTAKTGLTRVKSISDEVWLTGRGGTIIQSRNGAWVEHKNQDTSIGSTIALHALWGSAPDDVWVGGMGGTCRNWNGQTWETDPGCNTSVEIRSIWGYGKKELWMANVGGSIRFLDRLNSPLEWREWRTDPIMKIHGLWGAGQGQVWAVGDAGTILRYQP